MESIAEEYYHRSFRKQFSSFISKTKAHEHSGEGIYISIQELNRENLADIPAEDYMLFHCALAGTVLVDQIFFTHFKRDYLKFQKVTQYPKFQYGISNINISPWDITHSAIGLTTLENFFKFFLAEIKDFFATQKFEGASWEGFRRAALDDVDVTRGSRGEIFKKLLSEQE